MGADTFGKGILITILIGFVLELFTNVFGIFPWALGIVMTTNTAAKEASTYNTFFVESRLGLEQRLNDMPQLNATVKADGVDDTTKKALLASSWFPKHKDQIAANMGVGGRSVNAEGKLVDDDDLSPSKVLNIASSNIIKNSKVIMVEGHGYMGVKYSELQNTDYDQSQLENKVAESYDYNTQFGNYLDPIDIYTFSAYPLRFGIGTAQNGKGTVILIPWVYHSGSTGLHLYREQVQEFK